MVKQRTSKIYAPIQQRIQGFQKKLRVSATSAEKLFKKAMHERGLKFKFQKYFYSLTYKCIVDFYFASDNAKIAVELDGGYHDSDSQQARDSARTSWLLLARNCKVIRFTNEEVFDDVDKCLIRLADYYLKYVKRSQSKNFKIFCTLAGKEMPASKEKKPLAVPDWQGEDALF